MSHEKISLLTLNCWGLKYISTSRRERLKAIAQRLSESENSIVALQEVWCQEDWDEICLRCDEQFPYKRWFSSGIVAGPGLAILSKYPIRSSFLYRFPVNGRPSAFWRGDWYVGKSISVTVLDIDGNSIAVLNSHLHAPYALSGDAKYECHRTIQTWDFAKLIKVLKDAGHAIIVVGDMNSRKGELSYELLTQNTGLIDSWEEVHEPIDLSVMKKMSPIDQVEIGGATCDTILNTWRASRQPWEACRLDYALVDKDKFKVFDAKVVFTEKIPKIGSYSDHFGYEVKLEFLPNIERRMSLMSSLAPVKINLTGAKQQPDIGLDHQLKNYTELLELIRSYRSTSIWQKQWRLGHFFVSISLFIGITVITIFTSIRASYSSVFWVIASTVITVTGVVDGLIGFLFGNYELRELKEVELEVEDTIRWLEYQTSRADK